MAFLTTLLWYSLQKWHVEFTKHTKTTLIADATRLPLR